MRGGQGPPGRERPMLCDELGLYAADSMWAEDTERAWPAARPIATLSEGALIDQPVACDGSTLDRRLIAILRSLDR